MKVTESSTGIQPPVAQAPVTQASVSPGPVSQAPAAQASVAQASAPQASVVQTPVAQALTQFPGRFNAFPLSFAQQRLWFLQHLDPLSTAYHIPIAVRLHGVLSPPHLAQALADLVARHESLRTRIVEIDGEAVQVIDPPRPITIPLVDISDISGISTAAALPAAHDRLIAKLLDDEANAVFDLARGPLLRARLIREATDTHVLAITMHHVVSDGWSSTVLMREWAAFYAARVQGQGHEANLPELSVQYADYALWQREWLQGDALERELAWWRARLAGAPDQLAMPTDRQRPVRQTHRGARQRVTLSAETGALVRALSQREGVTPFMTLLASFQALLSRYTNQTDIIVGSPIAGREQQELEPLIGLFVNTLTLRTDLSGDPSVRTLLARVREVCLDAYAHQALPFERLVEDLRPERDLSRTPLVQALFSLDRAASHASSSSASLAGLRWEELASTTATAKFDVALLLIEHQDGRYDGAIEYAADLFDAPTMARFAEHWRTLVTAAVEQPERTLSALPLLTSEEARQVRVDWQGTAGSETPVCLHEMFEAQVRRTPGNIAITCDGVSLTYAELDALADRLAHHLAARGVGPDVRVALLLERSIDLVAAVLAVLKAGGAYVPLDPSAPPARLTTLLADAGVTVAIVHEATRDRLPPFEGTVVDAVVDAGAPTASNLTPSDVPPSDVTPTPSESRSRIAPDHLAYIIYTSGSTGQPKGVMVTHANVSRLMLETQATFQFSETDCWTLFHAYTFDFSVWEIWGALLFGGKLVVVPYVVSRTPEDFYALLARERVTVLNQTPSAFRQLCASEQAIEQAKEQTAIEQSQSLALRYVVFGGEALAFDTLQPWVTRHGVERPELINMYGITETTVHVTFHRVTADDVFGAAGSIVGHPLPDLQTYIVEPGGQLAPIGVPGEIYVGGRGLARGYVGKPAWTAERFVPDPFGGDPGGRLYRTGDLARWRPGGVLEYLGRCDQQVKIRGYRIELGEIEAALRACPDVRDAVVIADEPSAGEKRLIAYVACVSADGTELDTAGLRRALQARLPDYMVPAHYVPLTRLPLTPNGKVDRRALPPPREAARTDGGEFVPPRNDVEEMLASTWAVVLGVERVGIHDNFFALGGDSIRSIRMIALARERGLIISLVQLYTFQTIAELAAVLDTPASAHLANAPSAPFALLDDEDVRRLPPGVEDAYPLTMLQQGMLFHNELNEEAAAYHNVYSVELEFPFQREEFERALTQVIARHAVLRTGFDLTTYRDPLQLVYAEAPLPLVIEDWRELMVEEQEQRVAAIVTHERETAFDVTRAPLFRMHIARRSDRTLQFTFTEYHPILDGWSVHSTLTELFDRYFAGVRGDDAGLSAAPPAVSFRDFVFAERAALASADMRAFWREELDGAAPAWPAFCRETDAAAAWEPRRMERRVPTELASALRALARQERLPLKTLFLTAHLQVMAAITGQRDILTGLSSNGRPETAGGEQVRGLFLNMVPFRAAIGGVGDRSWMALANAVFDKERALLPYRAFPYAELQREKGREPVVEVSFTYLNFHVMNRMFGPGPGHVSAIRHARKFESSAFPLEVTFSHNPVDAETITLSMAYRSPRVRDEDATRIAEYLFAALQSMTREPESHPSRLGLLPVAERDQLRRWSERSLEGETLRGERRNGGRPERAAPKGRTLEGETLERETLKSGALKGETFEGETLEGEALEGETLGEKAPVDVPARDGEAAWQSVSDLVLAAAARAPEAVALRSGGAELSEPSELSYGALTARAARWAEALRVRGVGPDVRVGICLPREPEIVIALLAVMQAGGAYVPIEPDQPARRRRGMAVDAGIAVMITRQALSVGGPWRELRVEQESTWTAEGRPRDESRAPERPSDRPDNVAREPLPQQNSSPSPVRERGRGEGGSPLFGRTVQPAHAAYVLYTSGSTGTPKGVVVSHGALSHYVTSAAAAYGVGPDTIAPLHTPIGFDLTVTSLWVPLSAGAVVELLPTAPGVEALAEFLGRVGRVDRAGAGGDDDETRSVLVKLTPAHLDGLIAAGTIAPGAGTFVIGGEALLAPAVRAWMARAPGSRVINEYGPTEATVGCCVYTVSSVGALSSDSTLAGTRGVVSVDTVASAGTAASSGTLASGGMGATGGVPIGRPLTATRLYVVSLDGTLAPIGVPGEIWIGGPGLARGYLGMPETTAARFVPDPFSGVAGARLYRTGDLGWWRPDGELEYVGRRDAQVKLRGYRIELGEVEAALRACDGVREAAVIVDDASPANRRLVAYYVGTPPAGEDLHDTADRGATITASGPQASSPSPQELRDALAQRLPAYMVPAQIIPLESMPLTRHGKIDRRALPSPDALEADAEAAFIPPRTPTEDILAGLWRELLASPESGRRLARPLGIHDDFFALGGHSLLATVLVSRIRAAFSIELPLRTLFDAPTIARLAEAIDVRRREGQGLTWPPIVPAPRDEALPLSFAQQRLWFLHQLDPTSTAYHVPAVVRLTGALDVASLGAALGAVIARHETLRTRFVARGDEAVQVVMPPEAAAAAMRPVIDIAGVPVEARTPLVTPVIAAGAARPLVAHGDEAVQIGTPSASTLTEASTATAGTRQATATARATEAAMAIPLIDVSGVPDEARATMVTRLIEAEAVRPFDLTRGVLRVRLVRESSTSHVLAVVMHHIASDAWSMGVLMHEWSACYAALAQTRSSSSSSSSAAAAAPPPQLPLLPPPTIQYADYAVWQRQVLQGEALETLLAAARARLTDAPEVLALPTDRPRPPRPTRQGAQQPIALDRDLAARVRVLSQREGVTLFMTLLAAFKAVLARYSGQTDLVVGTPIAGRDHAALEPLIGFFVNTLALRTDLSGAPTFRALLGRVRDVCLDAYAQQALPFERLVEELRLTRDPSRPPLVQVICALQPHGGPGAAPTATGVTWTAIGVPIQTAKFDLGLLLTEHSDGTVEGVLEYATELFDAATIARLGAHWQMLLAAAVAAPEQSIATLPLIDATEAAHLRTLSCTPAPLGAARTLTADDVAAPRRATAVMSTDDDAIASAWREGPTLGVAAGAQVPEQMREAVAPSAEGEANAEAWRGGPAPGVAVGAQVAEQMREGIVARGAEGEANAHTWRDVPALVAAAAADKPEAIAVRSAEGDLTYAALTERASRWAAALRALDVGPDVRVGICLPREPALIVAVLAVLNAGGAYVPIEPDQPARRRRGLAADADVAVMITTRTLAVGGPWCELWVEQEAMWATASASTAASSASAAASSAAFVQRVHPLQPTQPAQAAYVLYTSGSTGTPKGVVVSHGALAHYVRWAAAAYDVGPGTIAPLHTPLGFDLTVTSLWAPLIAGACVELLPAAPGVEALAAFLGRCGASETTGISETNETNETNGTSGTSGTSGQEDGARPPLVKLTPAHLDGLIAADATAPRGGTFVVGGEALLGPAVRAWLARAPGARVINEYGPTETTVGCCVYAMTDGESATDGGVPIGRPVAETGLYVVEPGGTLAPIGVPGEICIGGSGLARGYLGQAEATASRFVPDPFSGAAGARLYRTGDVGRWRADGELEYVGRRDAQVKLRGYRIELGEVEAALRACDGVREAAVIVDESSPATRRLVAYYVAAHPAGHSAPAMASSPSPSPQQLRDALGQRLPEYMVPAFFIPLAALPLTRHGKIDRRALPAVDTVIDGSDGDDAPRTATEQVLAQTWAHLLGVERVDLHDDFFALGGHSLLATVLVTRIRAAFDVVLPIRMVFETPTLVRMAEAIERARHERHPETCIDVLPPIERASRDKPLPLSFAQQRLWFLHQLDPASTAYHVPAIVRLTGALDVAALGTALGTVIGRHEALRTRFVARGDEAMQIVMPLDAATAADAAASTAGTIPVIDVSGVPDEARGALVTRLIEAEAVRPFDLTRDVLRVRLVRESPGSHVLAVVMHHIVSDAWSMGVLMHEWSACYAALAQARSSAAASPQPPQPLSLLPPLPPLTIQYADYAVWQRQVMQGATLETLLAAARARLADAPEVLAMPTDRPRPVRPTREGAHQPIALDAELAARVRALSRREGVTLFMTLLAAFKAVLARYSGQTDLVVGTPIAGRDHAALEPLIGFFVNTLALRTDLSGAPTFRALLARVREVCLEAYAQQALPFERLVEELRLTRDPGRPPLVQVICDLKPHGGPGAAPTTGVTWTPIGVSIQTAKFDLGLLLTEHSDGRVDGVLEYATELFDAATIARLGAHWRTLLAAAVAAPEQSIATLPLIDATEAAHLRKLACTPATLTPYESTDDEANAPAWRDVPTLVASVAAEKPEAIAVRSAEGDLSYAALTERASRWAAALRALDVGPDVRVGICLTREPELIVAVLAVLSAGGAYVPIEPDQPARRRRGLAADANVAVMITRRTLSVGGPWCELWVEQEAMWTTASLSAAASSASASSAAPAPVQVQPAQAAYVLYTSGSTGTPKGVVISHGALAHYARWAAAAYDVGPGTVAPLHTPLGFDLTVTSLWAPLIAGACVELLPIAPGVEALVAFIGRDGTSGASGTSTTTRTNGTNVTNGTSGQADETRPPLVKLTPAHLDGLIAANATAPRGGTFVVGGEALTAPAVRAWLARAPGARVINEYGPTETTVGCCVYAITNGESVTDGSVPIGRPLPQTTLYVVEPGGTLAPIGMPGELYIGGPGVARGYLGQPETTAACFVPDPFSGVAGARLYRTGDVGRWRADGELEYVGRRDAQVKLRGYRIELGEVEAALRACDGVREAAVIVDESSPATRRLVAYYVAAHPTHPTHPTHPAGQDVRETGDRRATDLADHAPPSRRSGGALSEGTHSQSRQIAESSGGERSAPAPADVSSPSPKHLHHAADRTANSANSMPLPRRAGGALGGRLDSPSPPRPTAENVGSEQSASAPASAPSPQQLRDVLLQRLPEYMVPAFFIPLAALPLTRHGKIDRRALPAVAAAIDGGDVDDVPRTPAEQVLAQTWAHLLGVERVGLHDDFFALGGHSLLATVLVTRVRAAFEIELPIRIVFEAPTLARMAEAIERARTERRPDTSLAPLPPIERASRDKPLPLSFAQQRLWFMQQLDPASTAYHIATALRIRGALNVKLAAAALGQLVERHESLRTRFVEIDGVAMQVIDPPRPLQAPVIDLSAVAPAARGALLSRLIAASGAQPFDLTRGDLLRLCVFRESADQHVLAVTMHHLVSDALSAGVLMREWAALYDALVQQRSAMLDVPAVQYADFAVWQRRWLQGERLDAELSYWRRQLAGMPDHLTLPADRPRPTRQTYRGAHHPVIVPPEVAARVRALSRAEGVTPFMTLLASFQTLLFRYSGQTDLVIGSPIANRQHRELEPLIGFFANTLALRTDLSGEPTFRALLTRVRSVCLDAYAHQALPFDRLVEELRPDRDLSRSPLIQVVCSFHTGAAPTPPRAATLECEPLSVENRTAKFDLELLLSETGDRIGGAFEYATDLFDEATVARLAEHWLALLDRFTAQPETVISFVEPRGIRRSRGARAAARP